VSPSNWNPDKYKNYRYVQAPGDDNSLGNVKFNFPNHYSVYLHDTNHRDYFNRTFRSLSSGCVRVENPLPLAQYMLGEKMAHGENLRHYFFGKNHRVAIKGKNKHPSTVLDSLDGCFWSLAIPSGYLQPRR
jgi:murein L,D-transpeptidase YcbB/YkuD